jgi:iron(III) transport system substrate-binding protein
MAENDARTYANNNAIVEAVGRGEIPMGLVNHYYNERFLEEDPGLPSRNHMFPGDDLGSMPLVTTASMLAGTDREEDAQRFVEYLLSRCRRVSCRTTSSGSAASCGRRHA